MSRLSGKTQYPLKMSPQRIIVQFWLHRNSRETGLVKSHDQGRIYEKEVGVDTHKELR